MTDCRIRPLGGLLKCELRNQPICRPQFNTGYQLKFIAIPKVKQLLIPLSNGLQQLALYLLSGAYSREFDVLIYPRSHNFRLHSQRLAMVCVVNCKAL